MQKFPISGVREGAITIDHTDMKKIIRNYFELVKKRMIRNYFELIR